MPNTRPDIRSHDSGARGREEAVRAAARETSPGPPVGAPITALSAAAKRFARREDRRHHLTSGRPALLVGLLLSCACGVIAVFVVPFQHPCAATLVVRGDGSLARLGHIRKELLDFVWGRKTFDGAALAIDAWRVDSTKGDELRLTILSPDRTEGVQFARRMAEDFVSHLERGAAVLRTMPTEAEDALRLSLDGLEDRLNEAQAQVDIAMQFLPAADPRARRDDLAARWDSLRDDFDAARGQVRSAVAGLDHLESAPEPTHGVVPSSVRADALAADAALQQDLRELSLRLTEVRSQVLRQGAESLAPLEKLEEAERSFDEIVARVRDTSLPSTLRDEAGEMARRAEKYGQALASFAKGWREALSGLQSVAVDALSGEILDGLERMRRAAGDFLFSGADNLSSLRKHVSTLSDLQVDGARFPMLESEAVRAFHGLQAAHHRLGFAVAFIDSSDNFRLDAALRAARGLRRRTQERIRSIEQRIEAEAARRAREQRDADKLLAERLVRKARDAADSTIGQLVELQAQLNSAAVQSDAFHDALRRLESATSRLEATRTHHQSLESQLRSLQARREQAEFAPPVELAHCGVSGYPVNLVERLTHGAIAGSLSFAAVLGSFRLNRRNTR